MSASIHASPFDARARELGAAVKHLRGQRGWSGRELAAKLDATGHRTAPSTLGKMETGDRQISAGDLLALAHVFELPVADLVDYEAVHRREMIADLEAQLERLRSEEAGCGALRSAPPLQPDPNLIVRAGWKP